MRPLASPQRVFTALALLCLLVAASPVLAGDNNWRPIDPSELSLKEPKVEKDADAEAIFWDVRINDDPGGDLIFDHYVRIKVFTERGKESQSRIDIPFGKIFGNNIKIQNIAARTIKPDGTIVELNNKDVYERDVVRLSGLRLRAKSFAMPGVEPGSVIEYRWREVRANQMMFYIRLQFQRDIPVQQVKYYLKPYPFPGLSFLVATLHGPDARLVKDKDGYYSITMTNMPAFLEEPRMPPEDQVRTWSLVYYARPGELKQSPQAFWKQWGKEAYELHKSDIKVTDEVKRAAAEGIGDATTTEEKLKRLDAYCRTKIKNVNDDALGLTPEQRAKVKTNKSPADILKRGQGTSEDIDMLFAALAIAAGFDARVGELGDRGDLFFEPSYMNGYFLGRHVIAVKDGENWRFFDPASSYVPYGMLPWRSEGQDVLILDPKEPFFVKTPISAPSKSLEKRTANLRLTEDGTLEGDVRIEYYGHLGADKKELNDDDSPAEREQALRNLIKERMSTAEVEDIRVENVSDTHKPFTYAFKIRVPGYAERTGKRLFLKPSFFHKGTGSLFRTSSRRYDVYFNYPWSEEDNVTIELPAGYALDNPDAPTPLKAGGITSYEGKLMATKDGRKLILARKFFFGGDDSIVFPVTSYSHWYTELSDSQATLDDAVAGKARELTDGAKTELEKIRAIARFIQSLQYISIQIGVGRYKPHSATEVLAKAYGDCKDKANLMRAMLKAVKINSFMVLIFSGDPNFVREEWPSPAQFNHAIIAIQVSKETDVPTVIEHPKLGRLLIFDATDEITAVGDLPFYEQGSFALVAAGNEGSLVRMPVTPPEANRLERQAEVVLNSEGSISAKVKERSLGQAAVLERGMFRSLSRAEYMKLIETRITAGATSAKLNRIEPVEDRHEGRFNLDVDFTAERYAQLMQDRLLVFKPAIVARLDALSLTRSSRKAPVVLKSRAYMETVRIQLPEGFEVDEVPEALKIETPFGNYVATYEVKEGHLLFTRTLSMRAMTVPAEQYTAVRSFFERIRATEQAPVVLAKK